MQCSTEARLLNFSSYTIDDASALSVIDPGEQASSGLQNKSVYAVVKWGGSWGCFIQIFFLYFSQISHPPHITTLNFSLRNINDLTVLINIDGRRLFTPISAVATCFHRVRPESIYISRGNEDNLLEKTFESVEGRLPDIYFDEAARLEGLTRIIVGVLDVRKGKSRLLQQTIVLEHKLNILKADKKELKEFIRKDKILKETSQSLINNMFILYLEHVTKQRVRDSNKILVNAIFILYLKSLTNRQNQIQ